MGQIDKEETIERIRAKMNSGQWSDAVIFGMGKAISIIEAIQEKPCGEWVYDDRSGQFICPECEGGVNMPTLMGEPLYKWCPWCGEDMRPKEGDVNEV